MSDLELLFLVLVALYGWECACWIPRGSVVFLTWLGRRWRTAHPGSLLGNQRGGFVFASPLPPLGTLLTGNQFSLSLSPEAVLAYVAPTVNPGWRPPQTGKLFRFTDIRSVEAAGKKVLLNGELLLKASSPTFAAFLAGKLEELRRIPSAGRASAIEEMMRGGFDTKGIELRWEQFRQQTVQLRQATNFLFAYLFVLAPILIWTLGFRRCWLGLAIGVLACTVTTAVLFRRVHKVFYPGAEDDRFTHFLIILLSPATTIRAHDLLSRPLLETFHPLAVAKVFCREPQFRDFAQKLLREVRYPGLPLCPSEDPMAQAAERHGRGILQNEMERFLRQNGFQPEAFLRPPAPTDESCHAYCPRCLAQFTTVEGVCADCGGLRLESLPVARTMASTGTKQ